MRPSTALLAILALTACGPIVQLDEDPGGDEGATTSGPSEPSQPTSPWVPPATTSTTATPPPDATGVADAESGDEPPSTFLPWVDGNIDAFPCDTFAQDCPPGQKCTIWANDGGPVWNATRCVDIAPDPAQVGEPCTVEGSGVTGIDTCDLGLFCWYVDETAQGECLEFCGGDPSNPTCPDMHTCTISGDGVLTLCIPQCDPVMPTCDPDQGCYPVGDTFACAPDASGDLGAQGDPCEYLNACDPGTICIPADAHSACEGSGCCSSVCNHLDPMADAFCTGLDPIQTCMAWFEAGLAPDGYDHVGVCASNP